MLLDFQLLCEQVLLEEDLDNSLVNVIKPLVDDALKDYKNQKNNPNINKKFLHNALWSEIKDIKKDLAKEIAQYKIPAQTENDIDKFIQDKKTKYPFLRILHSQYIKQI